MVRGMYHACRACDCTHSKGGRQVAGRKVRDHHYRCRGACNELLRRYLVEHNPPEEALVEGPAGTGKSRTILTLIDTLCRQYPGIRCLVMRAVRVDMNESTLMTFETKVLLPGDPLLRRRLSREHRRKYVYESGSEIVLSGMDQPTRLFSTEYDVIYVNEATELTEAEYESLFRALRNAVYPHGQPMICDCNPDAASHWLNRRPERAGSVMERFRTRHFDNPAYFDDDGKPTELGARYLARLERLGGVRRDRLYLGKWVTAEGVIWDTYDPAIHLINPGERTETRPYGRLLPNFLWTFAAIDFGFRAPGCMALYGVTHDRRLYRLAEHYRKGKDIDWWADIAVRWQRDHGIRRLVCDPSRPDDIAYLNRQMGRAKNREGLEIAVRADNRHVGLGVVREAFRERRLFLVRGGLVKPDPELVEDGLPTCTEEEIPSYVWAELQDGKPAKEEPEPGVPDHGCDQLRYAVMFALSHDLDPDRHARRDSKPALYSRGTYGDWLGHDEVANEWRQP
ncbi:MAG: hypothetical protein D6746_11390 [Bacteroidetes bacterium]|nr:MAG: hypothetical protein D6746_11390 [Bacteroidota bacterium]